MMRVYYLTTIKVFTILLLSGIICLSGVPAAAGGLEVSYAQQIVENAHYYYSLQCGSTLELGANNWLTTEIGLGDLMDFEHSVVSFDLGLFASLTEYPDYAVGLGYRYLFDRRSYFDGLGGRLKEHELAFKLLGSTYFGKTRVDAELSYTPLGAYKFMNDFYRPLTAFRFSLGAVVPFGEYWDLTLKAMRGSQSYMDDSRPAALYRIGLAYRFH